MFGMMWTLVVVFVFHVVCGASASGDPVGVRSGLVNAPAGAVGNSGNGHEKETEWTMEVDER